MYVCIMLHVIFTKVYLYKLPHSQQGHPDGHGVQYTGHGEFLVQYIHTQFYYLS